MIQGLIAATIAVEAQERLPLEMAREDQGVNIEKVHAGVRLSPSGEMLPLYYRSSPSVTNASSRWILAPATKDAGYVNQRSLTLTNLTDTVVGKFIRAAYPDFSKLNGFVRLPAGVPREQLSTLVVTLHPTLGITNAGYHFETEVGPVCDKFNLVSYFPTAIAVQGSEGSFWRGQDGPQGPDYASVMDGIKACKRLVPTIKRVGLAAYSRGVETAIGLAQLYTQEFDGLLIISGLDNPATTAFVETMNGGQSVRFKPPFPVVGLASPRDEGVTLPPIRTACKWFAAANGFTGEPVTNSVRGDFIKDVPGVDGTVVSYGDHVRLIIHDAKNHWDSTFLSDAGFDATYRDFLRDGKLPGGD